MLLQAGSRLAVGLVACATLLGGVAAPSGASGATPTDDGAVATAESVPNRFVVSWNPTASAPDRADVRGRHGLRTEERLDAIDVEVVSARAQSADEVVAALTGEPAVSFAEPDFVMETETDDPHFDRLWGLHNTGQGGGVADVDIDAPEAWEVTRGDHEVVVAVVDTGVDISHPDLAANIWVNADEVPDNGVDDDDNGYVDDVNGWDFYTDDNTVYDDPSHDDHGTHVAGTIAASADNDLGVAGVAPDVTIMPVKFLGGPDGKGSSSDAAAAIAYAYDNGATVINASWGGGSSTTMAKAIDAAPDAVVVASAGNEGIDVDTSTSSYPARWADDSFGMTNVLSVASIDRAGDLSSFSNHGSASVDIGAPGSEIYSTLPENRYGSMWGTSMAAPHASGVAALLASQRGSVSGAQLAAAVKDGAQPLDSLALITTTGAVLNARAAVEPYAAPGVPAGVSAVAGDAKATVTWSAPTEGGIPTSYTVAVSPGTGVTGEIERTVDAPETQLSFDGLANGTAYTFTVSAVNASGTSAPSAPSAAVTPLAAAPPPPPPPPPSDGGGGGGTSSPPPPPSEPPPPPPAELAPAPAPAPAPEDGSETGDTPAPYDGSGARSLDWACPGVSLSGFEDVPAGSVHAAGVGCAGAWGVFAGSADGAFGANAHLTRGQLASVLVRAIEQALGRALPAGRDHFVDDDASVHRAAIDKLAELGIVGGFDASNYGPGRPVTRGQFATMLARTYRHLADGLPQGSDTFVDDDGTVHESSIDGLSALGIVAGTDAGRYRPGTDLSRAQSATLVARLLDALVEAGVAPRRV